VNILLRIFVAPVILFSTLLFAQDISGNWQAIVPGGLHPDKLPGDRILLHVHKGFDNDWSAILYSIDRYGSSHSAGVTSMTLANSDLKFIVPLVHGSYTGTLSADGITITGRWMAGINWRSIDLRLRRPHVVERMTVEQLEHMLADERGQPDKKLAHRLEGVQLSERLSAGKLAGCEAIVPGRDSRRALLALSDASAFLDLPPSEIPHLPMPDAEIRNGMIKLTVNYVVTTIHQLPNLFATRSTTSFQEDIWGGKPLHLAATYSANVLYRNGDEHVREAPFQQSAVGLTTSGEFGPILGTAILDAAKGHLIWSRWENSPSGPLAVFRYEISADHSHYNVDGFPCAYQGEIAVDPATGAILRVVLNGEPEPPNPLLTASIAVEYGPVDLGGKTYICPLKGVALSQQLETICLNDVTFDRYHLYHATARILPSTEETPR
jgi:hypothetical protein